MHPSIKQNLNDVAGICQKRHVVAMAIFGSAVTNKFNERSDVDLVVTFGEIPLLEYADNFFDLKSDLEKLFGRNVDIVISSSLENPYLIEEIERTKQVVYAA